MARVVQLLFLLLAVSLASASAGAAGGADDARATGYVTDRLPVSQGCFGEPAFDGELARARGSYAANVGRMDALSDGGHADSMVPRRRAAERPPTSSLARWRSTTDCGVAITRRRARDDIGSIIGYWS